MNLLSWTILNHWLTSERTYHTQAWGPKGSGGPGEGRRVKMFRKKLKTGHKKTLKRHKMTKMTHTKNNNITLHYGECRVQFLGLDQSRQKLRISCCFDFYAVIFEMLLGFESNVDLLICIHKDMFYVVWWLMDRNDWNLSGWHMNDNWIRLQIYFPFISVIHCSLCFFELLFPSSFSDRV